MSHDKTVVVPINFQSEENSQNIQNQGDKKRSSCLSRTLKLLCRCFVSSKGRSIEEITLLPPEKNSSKKTLVLDLDETLVHSTVEKIADFDMQVKVTIDGLDLDIYVLIRPGTYELLESVADNYEIVIFTASLKSYADPVIDFIDRSKVVSGRLYRSDCLYYSGNYIKNLSLLGRDLKKVIIVDNSPISYAFHPYNAIPINSWFNDFNDDKLMELIGILNVLSKAENVQIVIKKLNENRMELSPDNFNTVLEQGRSVLNSPKPGEIPKFEFK